MPAKSQAQQRFMGMVHAAQEGKLKGKAAKSPAIEKAAKTMTKKAAKDFASTPRKGLPKKVSEQVLTELSPELRDRYITKNFDDCDARRGKDRHSAAGDRKTFNRAIGQTRVMQRDAKEDGDHDDAAFHKSGTDMMVRMRRKSAAKWAEKGKVKESRARNFSFTSFLLAEAEQDYKDYDRFEEWKQAAKDLGCVIVPRRNEGRVIAMQQGTVCGEFEDDNETGWLMNYGPDVDTMPDGPPEDQGDGDFDSPEENEEFQQGGSQAVEMARDWIDQHPNQISSVNNAVQAGDERAAYQILRKEIQDETMLWNVLGQLFDHSGEDEEQSREQTWDDELARSARGHEEEEGVFSQQPDPEDDPIECPYCGKEAPSGLDHPSQFVCCGEVGHGVPRSENGFFHDEEEEQSRDATWADALARSRMGHEEEEQDRNATWRQMIARSEMGHEDEEECSDCGCNPCLCVNQDEHQGRPGMNMPQDTHGMMKFEGAKASTKKVLTELSPELRDRYFDKSIEDNAKRVKSGWQQDPKIARKVLSRNIGQHRSETRSDGTDRSTPEDLADHHAGVEMFSKMRAKLPKVPTKESVMSNYTSLKGSLLQHLLSEDEEIGGGHGAHVAKADFYQPVKLGDQKNLRQFGDKQNVGNATEKPAKSGRSSDFKSNSESGQGEGKEPAVSRATTKAAVSRGGKSVDFHGEDEQKSKPSAGLSKEQKSAVAKKAHKGENVGHGNFGKVAAKAAKEYGSKEAGEKVAAASMWRNQKR